MIIVLFTFSTILIFALERNIEESLTARIEQGDILEEAILETNKNVEALVFMLDGLLLILIGGASYFLADRTLQPIKIALDSQKRFSADASHDLRTPLSIIMSETEVMLGSNHITIDECKKVFKSNLEEANRMSALISDLLMIARTEQDFSQNDLVVVSIEDQMQKIVEKMLIQARSKNITVKFINKVSGDIKIHKYNFERAVENIIQNAINYTPNGGNITIDVLEHKSSFVINIIDTGVGISSVDLPHIFDRFYKASHSRNDESGSGLGLPIAKQIIEQHNGTIVFESKIGVGTSVSIKIPKI